MTAPRPEEHMWWLASRASGVVALVLITASVILGLSMSSKLARRWPGLPRRVIAIHEQAAVTSMVAIAVHGITLLGDPFLRPGVVGITVPFAMDFKSLWVGLGVISGYAGVIFGLTFYARQRIGAKLWRQAHRFSIVVYALAVVHTVGAGTDARSLWMLIWLGVTTPVVLGLLGTRILSARKGLRPASAPHQTPRATSQPVGVLAEEAS